MSRQYTFTLTFETDNSYLDFLMNHIYWKMWFSFDIAFICGLYLKKRVENKLIFISRSERTYTDDVFLRFEILFNCLRILLKEDIPNHYIECNKRYLYGNDEFETIYPNRYRDVISSPAFFGLTPSIITYLGFLVEELKQKSDNELKLILSLDKDCIWYQLLSACVPYNCNEDAFLRDVLKLNYNSLIPIQSPPLDIKLDFRNKNSLLHILVEK